MVPIDWVPILRDHSILPAGFDGYVVYSTRNDYRFYGDIVGSSS